MQWRGLGFIISIMGFAVGLEFDWYRIMAGSIVLLAFVIIDAALEEAC